METHQIIGAALVAAGLLDAVLCVPLLAVRVPDEGRRRIVVGAVLSGGAMMVLLGAAIALGLFGL